MFNSNRLQEYQQYIDSDTYNKGCINDTDQLDLIQNNKETDKIFESFKKRIAIEPEQVSSDIIRNNYTQWNLP